MECNRCGKCCKNPIITLNTPIGKDTQELGRWFSYFGFEPFKYKGVLAIRIPGTCGQLETKDGIYSCKIYENRPQQCKNAWCEKVIEKEVLELTKGDKDVLWVQEADNKD